MKRFLSVLLALVMVFSLMIPVSAASAHFTDVPSSSWYYNNVKTAYENGLMVGVNDTEFRPEDTLTRAMFVTVLGRVAKADLTEYEGTCSFSDVAKTAWYEPYVAWAQAKNVAAGVGNNRFAPDDPVTREQMAALIARYVKTSNITISNAASPAAVFKDTDQISSWAKESVEYTRLTGLLIGDDKGNFSPKKTATRAEAASLFIRLYKAIYTSFPQPVNTWLDAPAALDTTKPKYSFPEVSDPIVSNEELAAVLDAHPTWFSVNGVRYNALLSINTKYASQISESDRTKPLLFLFEGAGATSDVSYRMNCMCIVVINSKIVYINLYGTTIPDYPFDSSRNAGKAMPTIKSGIYYFNSTGHNGTYTHCPALHIYGGSGSVPVVRHSSQTSFTSDYTTQINIHRRYKNTIPTDYSRPVNSAGCLLVGREGDGPNDDYALFASAMGLINPGQKTDVASAKWVTGKVIIDRDAAGNYLKEIGWTPQAISLLG